MGYFEHKHKLESLLYYLESRSAITVPTLAQRLNVSERTILRMVEELRLDKNEIIYCKKTKGYIIAP